MLDGAGQLYQKYEELKKELEEMGMFDIMYKQPIPKYATKSEYAQQVQEQLFRI